MTERYRSDIDRPFVLDNELRRQSGDAPDDVSPRSADLQDAPRGGGGRFALFAVAIAMLLGAVFYGLNNSSMNPAGTAATQSTTTTTAESNSSPPVGPNVRDVTPRSNAEPGVTTGAAPSKPATPPATIVNPDPAASSSDSSVK